MALYFAYFLTLGPGFYLLYIYICILAFVPAFHLFYLAYFWHMSNMSDILSGIPSDILSGISSASEVRQCPLRSGACG